MRVCWLGLLVILAVTVSVPAQSRPPERKRTDAKPKRNQTEASRRRLPYYRDENGKRTRRYPRVFDMRPRFVRDGNVYRFGTPTFDQLREEELEQAYQQGVEDGRALERFEIQAERGLVAYDHAMEAGRIAFESGDYGLAARQLRLACTLNQGDPVSRLSAAHAHVALRDYDAAAGLLRRAFELQPRIAYLPLDVRDSYGRIEDFTAHLAALAKAAEHADQNGERWFLLGYYYYYTDDMVRATQAFERAMKLAAGDILSAQLLDLARLSVPKPLDGIQEAGGDSPAVDR